MSQHVISDGFGVGAEADELRSRFVNNAAPAAEEQTEETVNEEAVAEENTPEPTEEPVVSEPKEIDFSSKDFEKTQEMLGMKARMNSMSRELEGVKHQKNLILQQSFNNQKVVTMGDDEFADADAVIQHHLDKFSTFGDLQNYVKGDVKEKRVQDKIDEFFTNPKTGEVLELSAGTKIGTKLEEYEFKRGLLMYFKQNDEYIAKIDEEMAKLDEATDEFNRGITEVLNPLRDNILAYTQYLEDNNQPDENDDADTVKKKQKALKKAKAIRSGFTLENLIETIERTPSIKENSLKDFKNETRLQEIGKRYAKKLKTCKIDFNLFGLLSDDPKDSLEYRTLPKDDYPAGLEGFTVFFIIRGLAMTLPNKEDETFHAAVQVVFNQLLDGTLDEEIAEQVRNNLKKFLSYFA